jgi:TIR domain
VSGGVFISYRREETSGMAGRLYDWLANRFGENHVLIDVNTGEMGADFATVINRVIGACEVLLAVIGPQWLSAVNELGHRRLDEPDDVVRLEIEAALKGNLQVLPILVGGATMPRSRDLPTSVAELARRNALMVRHETFREDAKRLVSALESVLGAVTPAGFGTFATRQAMPTEVLDERNSQPIDRALQAGPRIFLSYRRDDTRWLAGRLYDRLRARYGPTGVFHDIDTIKPGVKYTEYIESAVRECKVVIVLIGDNWLSATDASGRRRLDAPRDMVRLEVAAALQHNIPIIPVLVQGAPMPSEEELPESIADLTLYNASEVTATRWDYDVAQLLQGLDDLIASDEASLWDQGRLREMYEGIPQHTRDFFDVLTANAGKWVSIDDMAITLGIEKSRVRGILSGYTRRLGTLFGGEKRWPMDYRVIDGRAHWMLPVTYAEILAGLKQ